MGTQHRLAIEAGEDPKNNPIEYILECIDTIYSIKHKNGAIRRVNVNIAATTVENYKKLKDAGIGTLHSCLQETYAEEAYEDLRRSSSGPKSDYAYHTEAMDRAMEAGIDDVGCSILFGLNLYKYDFVGILMHAKHLEDTFSCRRTPSVYRVCVRRMISIRIPLTTVCLMRFSRGSLRSCGYSSTLYRYHHVHENPRR